MLTMLTLRSVVAALSSIAILTQSSTAHSIKRSPLGYISLIDDPVIHTPSHRLHSHSDFHLTFTLHEGRQNIRLTLSPNHDIIHDDFAISYLTWDGTVRRTEKVLRSEHKVYRGDTFIQRPGLQGWSNAGWARISVYRDGERPVFDGVFRVDGDHHNIQTVDQYLRLRSADDPLVQPSRHGQDAMLVWRDSDIVDTDAGDHLELKRSVHDEQLCASESLSYNTRFDPRTQSSNPLVAMDWGSLLPRQIGSDSPGGSASISLDNSIGSLDGCPTTRKVALVGIAADCTYWEGFNNMADMRKSIISMVNKASQLYESTFKISLGIQNLTISDKACPATAAPSAPWNIGCSDRFNISDRLNTFSQWRGQFQDDNAYWTLLTRCNTNSAVGLAWRGQLCAAGVENNGESGEKVASANVVVGTDTEWQIFAHETGHTFGAFHDCTQATCGGEEKCCPLSRSSCDASGKFIMNPTTGKGITQFSPCSIGNICSGLKSSLVKGSCLTDNRNIKTITGSQCGNGIVESGEDCDCGGDQSCQGNRCCELKTCKFTAGSVCDPANEDCCTPECKFAGLDKVCRAGTGVCDPEETCSGDAAGCPGDKHKNDGDACGDGLSCASGQCTSRDQQCKVVTSNLRGISSTRACPGSSCRVSCMSSDLGPNECVMLSQNFVDGTSCGGGGKCINGSCQGASTINEIGQWINDNKSIFIPVVSVVGGLIVLAILISIISRIIRRIRRRKLISEANTSSWPSSHNGYDANRPPPPPPHHWQQQRQWGDVPGRSDRYNAQGHHQQPHYTPGVQPFPQHSSNQWSECHRSMRYA